MCSRSFLNQTGNIISYIEGCEQYIQPIIFYTLLRDAHNISFGISEFCFVYVLFILVSIQIIVLFGLSVERNLHQTYYKLCFAINRFYSIINISKTNQPNQTKKDKSKVSWLWIFKLLYFQCRVFDLRFRPS